jgi:hypothetical protein
MEHFEEPKERHLQLDLGKNQVEFGKNTDGKGRASPYLDARDTLRSWSAAWG